MRSVARSFVAESRKLLGLPSTWIGAAIALAAPPALVLLGRALAGGDADAAEPYRDAGFAELTAGVIGVIVLSVAAVSSEYARDRRADVAARQIAATLTAEPRRIRVLATKAAVVATAIVLLAAVVVPVTLALSHALGSAPAIAADEPGAIAGRAVGAGLYWLMTGLLAFAVTLLVRNGIVPMVVLVLNNSVMSLSLLVHHLTPLADYLPDLAGMRMYLVEIDWLGLPYPPVVGGLVMAAWTVAMLAAAAVAFERRDA